MGGQYRGSLNGTAAFKGTPEKGSLTVQANADNLGIGQAEADRLLRGQTQLSAALDVENKRIKINSAELRNPQLSASATGVVTDTQRQVDLNARLANLALILPDFPGALTVTGTAVDTAAGVTLNLNAQGPGQINATVNGRLDPGYTRGDLAIAGSAQAALANSFISPRSIDGPVRFDLRMNGPLALASLSGTVTQSGGRFSRRICRSCLKTSTAPRTLAVGGSS